MLLGTGWTLATGDRLINRGATLLYGWICSSDDGEGDAAIYEGLDSGSGRLILNILEADYPSPVVNFSEPLRLERGLYVDFGNKMNAILFRWDPVKDGKLPGSE